MARNDSVSVPSRTWTLLTNTAASSARISNTAGYVILLQATAGSGSAPTTTDGAVPLRAGQTVLSDVALATMFPGVVGADSLWAYADAACKVPVSHADG